MKEDLRYITEHMSTKRRLVKSKEKKKNLEMQRRLDEMEQQTEALLTEQSAVGNPKEKKLLDLQEVLSQYSEPMKQHIAIKMEQKQPENKVDAKDLLKAYEEKPQDVNPARFRKLKSKNADEESD